MEAWEIEAERRVLAGRAAKDVVDICKKMVEGKDRGRLAHLMGVERETFNEKVRKGRMTASEFFMLSYLCGYDVKVEDRYQLLMDFALDE